MHVGATLRFLRLEAGVGLRALAGSVGVSPAYLSRVELGRDPPPSPDRLAGIARALGIPPTAFLGVADLRDGAQDQLRAGPAGRRLLAELSRRSLTDAQLLRVLDFVQREFPLTEAAPPSLAALVTADRVLVGVQVDSLRDALDLLATRLAPSPDAAWLAERMAAREDVAPTAIGEGVALPVAPLSAPAAAVLTLSPPLPAPTPDGQPLRLLFAHGGSRDLAVPLRATRLAQREVVDAVCAAATPAAAVRALAEAEARW